MDQTTLQLICGGSTHTHKYQFPFVPPIYLFVRRDFSIHTVTWFMFSGFIYFLFGRGAHICILFPPTSDWSNTQTHTRICLLSISFVWQILLTLCNEHNFLRTSCDRIRVRLFSPTNKHIAFTNCHHRLNDWETLVGEHRQIKEETKRKKNHLFVRWCILYTVTHLSANAFNPPILRAKCVEFIRFQI